MLHCRPVGPAAVAAADIAAAVAVAVVVAAVASAVVAAAAAAAVPTAAAAAAPAGTAPSRCSGDRETSSPQHLSNPCDRDTTYTRFNRPHPHP